MILWLVIVKVLLKNRILYELIVIIKDFLTERTLGYHEEGLPKFPFPLTGEAPKAQCWGQFSSMRLCLAYMKLNWDMARELVSFADDLALIAGVDRTLDLHRTTGTIEKLDRNLNYLGLNNKTQMVIISKEHVRKSIQKEAKQIIKINAHEGKCLSLIHI